MRLGAVAIRISHWISQLMGSTGLLLGGFWCELKTDQFLAWVDFGEGGYLGFWFEMGYYKEEAVYISSSFL